MSYDLTNQFISNTFGNLLQKTGSEGSLYDLKGNQIGDIRISGSVTAQEYIVSSSVTNVVTLAQSGSTIFGDTPDDDKHRFTGSVYITGSILHLNPYGGATANDGGLLIGAQTPTDTLGYGNQKLSIRTEGPKSASIELRSANYAWEIKTGKNVSPSADLVFSYDANTPDEFTESIRFSYPDSDYKMSALIKAKMLD